MLAGLKEIYQDEDSDGVGCSCPVHSHRCMENDESIYFGRFSGGVESYLWR